LSDLIAHSTGRSAADIRPDGAVQQRRIPTHQVGEQQ
jgi:hypothetical protein